MHSTLPLSGSAETDLHQLTCLKMTRQNLLCLRSELASSSSSAATRFCEAINSLEDAEFPATDESDESAANVEHPAAVAAPAMIASNFMC